MYRFAPLVVLMQHGLMTRCNFKIKKMDQINKREGKKTPNAKLNAFVETTCSRKEESDTGWAYFMDGRADTQHAAF